MSLLDHQRYDPLRNDQLPDDRNSSLTFAPTTKLLDTPIPSRRTYEFEPIPLADDDVVIDLTGEWSSLADRPRFAEPADRADARPSDEPSEDAAEARSAGTTDTPAAETRRPAPRRRPVGIALRRVRLRSVLKVALVFFSVAYAALVGSAVLVWSFLQQIGMVRDFESIVTTALGMDTFELSGATLFRIVATGAGAICAFGLLLALLAAVVYNVTGRLFGGLAFETRTLHRPAPDTAAA